jgi:hypothetical protein
MAGGSVRARLRVRLLAAALGALLAIAAVPAGVALGAETTTTDVA